MMQYRERLIEVGEAFRADLVKANPVHAELPLIDAHLASLRAERNKSETAGQLTEEKPLVRNFTPGALKDLERNHGVVFDPLGASLAKLVIARKQFWHITNRDNQDFMNLVSRPTQIAIFPDRKQFYVPESNNLSLDNQRELLKVDLAEVVKRKWGIGGVEEVIDNVATHAGLVFAHFDKTSGKVRLHGKDYEYRYGRTETPTVGSLVADVGSFYAGRGLSVNDWNRGEGFGLVWAVRLVVPA